jgi:hypothetical protein
MALVLTMTFFFIFVTLVFVSVTVFFPEVMGITGRKAKAIIAAQQEEGSAREEPTNERVPELETIESLPGQTKLKGPSSPSENSQS